MKRFALKRITALALTIVMVLSLVPMTVWATETGAMDSGLYAKFEDGVLSGKFDMIHNTAHYYEVDYEGNGTTVYYWNSGVDTMSFNKEEGQGEIDVNLVECALKGLFSITLTEAEGTVHVQFTTGTQGGFPIVFSDGTDSGNNDNQGSEQNNYSPLFVYSKGQDGKYDHFNGTGFGVGGVQEFELYIRAQLAENGSWEYVPITLGDGYTLGCSDEILKDRVTWSTAEGKENVAIVDTRGITLNSEKQVYLTATKNGITYGLSLYLHPGDNSGGNQGGNQNYIGYPTFGNAQLYFSPNGQGIPMQRKMNVNAGTKQSFHLWYETNDGPKKITKSDVSEITATDSSIGTFTMGDDGKLTWDATNAGANRQAVLNVTVGEVTYQALIYTTASAENRVPDPEREGMDVNLDNASFKYKGTEYYLVPVYPSGNGVTRLLGSTFNIDKERSYFWSYTAALATTKNGTDFTLVYDEEVLELLKNVEFSLTALEREWITANGESMPLCMSGEAFADWGHGEQYTKLKTYNKFCEPIGFVFDISSAGPYKLTVSATVNGETISSFACTTAFYKETYVVDGLTTVADINAKLAQFKEDHPEADEINDEIVVVLPHGELEGVIQVPGGLPDVFFNGSEEGETVLRGGICAVNQITEVRNVRFVGAGKGVKMLSDGTTPNYGLWGRAHGGFFDCTFSGYDCAVVSTHGVRFGGQNSIFYNNRVALWMNIDPVSRQGGNLEMRRMVFAHNDVALQLDRFTSTLDLGIYITEQNIFYENGKDAELANSKRSFFMPGNVYDENSGVQRNFQGNVYGDPYYVLSDAGRNDLSFGEIGNLPLGTYRENWIASAGGKFIKVFPANWKVPMVYANANDYVIPANELKNGKMTIDVVDNTTDGTNGIIATITLKPTSENE